MARPVFNAADLQSGEQGWDAKLRDMIAAILNNPFPVHEVANEAARPPANQFARCLVTTADNNKLWFSNGTTWREVTFV